MENILLSDQNFNPHDKWLMLSIARETLTHFLSTGKTLVYDESLLPEVLLYEKGVFVSIHKEKTLKGCTGRMESNEPLYSTIQKHVISSATRDTRFFSIKYSELSRLSIEISVLGDLHKISKPEDIQPGKHGVYIRLGNLKGTFLPQVAVSTGWNAEELLGYCSRDKAGLGWDGWKTADVFIYTAEVFSENDF